jgi:hypothetical protein
MGERGVKDGGIIWGEISVEGLIGEDNRGIM